MASKLQSELPEIIAVNNQNLRSKSLWKQQVKVRMKNLFSRFNKSLHIITMDVIEALTQIMKILIE